MRKTPLRTFQPWPKNRDRLAFADKVGLNVSELINEVLDDHLKKHLEAKANKIREAVSSPIP
jgi:hypothetical protein